MSSTCFDPFGQENGAPFFFISRHDTRCHEVFSLEILELTELCTTEAVVRSGRRGLPTWYLVRMVGVSPHDRLCHAILGEKLGKIGAYQALCDIKVQTELEKGSCALGELGTTC